MSVKAGYRPPESGFKHIIHLTHRSMKKLYLLLFSAVILLVPYTARAAAVTFTVNGFTYSADDASVQKGAMVTGTTKTGAVSIPNTVAYSGVTYKVKAIKSGFINEGSKASVTSVYIPANVGSIASGAFGFSEALTAITVATANTAYRAVSGVLYNKAGTKLIYWPANKNTGGAYTIPSTVTALGADAFCKNRTLTSITFPASVDSIDAGLAVRDAVNAARVMYECGAFSMCEQLTAVTFEAGSAIRTISAYCFYRCSELETINMPFTVIAIGSYAFAYTKVNVSLTNVREVGIAAFKGCKTIEEAVFDDLKFIWDEAFMDCSGLKKVWINRPEIPTLVIRPRCFMNCSSLTTVSLLGGHIGEIMIETFKNCTSLVSADLSGIFYHVASQSFQNDSALAVVNFGDKLSYIDSESFDKCKALKSVTLPATLSILSRGAFMRTGLQSVHIPKNTSLVGHAAFGGCKDLTTITVEPGSRYYVAKDGVLFDYRMQMLVAYPAASTTHRVSYTVPYGVQTIGEGAFSYATLSHITLPATLRTIYNGAFAYNKNLTELTIPASVTSIGQTNAIYNGDWHLTLFNFDNIIHQTGVKRLYMLHTTRPPQLEPQGASYDSIKVTVPGGVYMGNGVVGYPPDFKVYLKKSTYDSGVFQAAAYWREIPADQYQYEVPLQLSSTGVSTMARDFDVDLSENADVTAYIAASVSADGKDVTMQPVQVTGKTDGKYVPARTGRRQEGGLYYETYTGVVLKGTPGGTSTYRIGETETAVAGNATSNKLLYATDDTRVEMTETIGGVQYTNLGLKQGMFKYIRPAGVIPYNHCYLQLPTSVVGSVSSAPAKAFKLHFDDLVTTAVEGLKPPQDNVKKTYYNLQGMRVDNPTQGIYILNGKKVIIK